jgi:hypothetical protein
MRHAHVAPVFVGAFILLLIAECHAMSISQFASWAGPPPSRGIAFKPGNDFPAPSTLVLAKIGRRALPDDDRECRSTASHHC